MNYCIVMVVLIFMFAVTADAAENGDAPDKPKLTIALLQVTPKADDQAANLKIADEACREAARMGADIALMPEMWNIGYADYPGEKREDRVKWEAMAVARDSSFVKHFISLAKELKMAIVVTYLEKWPKAPRNSATLIDRHGKQLFTYAKVHTCDFGTREAACTPGNDFYVSELDTAKGKINVGAMICYDREQPESARILMLKGAELILTPNACMIDKMRLDQFRVRAYENAVVVAMTNYPSGHPGCDGNSVAYGDRGDTIVHAKGQPGIYLASFDISALRDHRKHTIMGDAYRRPHRYDALVNSKKLPEFERGNGFGEKFESDKR